MKTSGAVDKHHPHFSHNWKEGETWRYVLKQRNSLLRSDQTRQRAWRTWTQKNDIPSSAYTAPAASSPPSTSSLSGHKSDLSSSHKSALKQPHGASDPARTAEVRFSPTVTTFCYDCERDMDSDVSSETGSEIDYWDDLVQTPPGLGCDNGPESDHSSSHFQFIRGFM